MLLYVHRDRKDYSGQGAQDVHLEFHTAPELWTDKQLGKVKDTHQSGRPQSLI